MKKNKNISYYCQGECEETTTNTLHEVIYGSCNRKLCIKYNLQIPLCLKCHEKVHREMPKIVSMKLFCLKLGIDYDKTRLSVNKLDYKYLEGIADQCKDKLKGWQV